MNYNKMIDHTVLKADATKAMVAKIIDEAKEYNFASVCVNPTWVAYCAQALADSDVKVCTVIGFPLGAHTSTVKAFETKDAIANGADEIDMVINIGALKDGNTDLVFNDIKAVVDAAAGKCVKVIIETCLLTDEEIVSLMKQTVGDDLEVKASGGVRTIEDMEKVVAAGATRIGTSAGCKLVKNNNS